MVPCHCRCEESPLLRIREHSAKALLSLIPRDRYVEFVNQRIKALMTMNTKENVRQNALHGRFLQVEKWSDDLCSHRIDSDQWNLSIDEETSRPMVVRFLVHVDGNAQFVAMVHSSVSVSRKREEHIVMSHMFTLEIRVHWLNVLICKCYWTFTTSNLQQHWRDIWTTRSRFWSEVFIERRSEAKNWLRSWHGWFYDWNTLRSSFTSSVSSNKLERNFVLFGHVSPRFASIDSITSFDRGSLIYW